MSLFFFENGTLTYINGVSYSEIYVWAFSQEKKNPVAVIALLTQRGRRKAGFHWTIDFSMYRTKPNINFIAH